MAESSPSFSAYLGRLFRRAKKETWPKNRPPFWLQTIGLIVAVVWDWGTNRFAFSYSGLSSFLFITAAALLTVNVLWFLWKFLLAPWRLAQVDAKEISKLQRPARKQIALKKRLEAGLRVGNSLVSECGNDGVDRVELESRFTEWFGKLQSYVSDVLGVDEAASLQPDLDTLVYSDPKQPNEDIRRELDHICQRLTHILQGIDGPPGNVQTDVDSEASEKVSGAVAV